MGSLESLAFVISWSVHVLPSSVDTLANSRVTGGAGDGPSWLAGVVGADSRQNAKSLSPTTTGRGPSKPLLRSNISCGVDHEAPASSDPDMYGRVALAGVNRLKDRRHMAYIRLGF